ncbi:MAG: 23S rRNA (uracil(1939)-C(5))-methyltransferase RlmD [Pseudobutyrivibrio sp.]|nr:23S rRNA (uracil(1939)-C(5))-methyltransferase RlmD [Pseudobutyrivibrio sp.]
MNKNDIVRLTIEDMSLEGAGIGHTDGVTIFVKDAVVGDVCDVIITKVKKTYCFATVKEVIEPSAYRVTPDCDKARQCGGCQIMQVDYNKQLEIKENIVANNLVKIGGYDRDYVDSIHESIIGMDEPVRYRNKAQVPIGTDKEGNLIAGFYGARSHRIVPNDDCKLCSKKSMDIVYAVIEYMKECKVPAYDEVSRRGLIRHVLVREGKATGETMVCVVVNGDKLPSVDSLISHIRRIEPELASLVLNINTRRDNVIMGFETKLLYGKEAIRDSITLTNGDTIMFDISANSFYQVNHDQMERLYSKALEYADLHGSESVWDLYCGIGTISLSMAKRAGMVFGIEVVPQAIENAKANAKINDLENARFFCGEAERILPEFYSGKAAASRLLENEGYDASADANLLDEMTKPDVIMVDPPRKGCDTVALDTMVSMSPQRIVYVSCDSATLARDLKYLEERGYHLHKYTVVDQFGHTMHTECVSLLQRMSNTSK